MYTDADLKISLYVLMQIKIIPSKYRILRILKLLTRKVCNRKIFWCGNFVETVSAEVRANRPKPHLTRKLGEIKVFYAVNALDILKYLEHKIEKETY